jgi:hypothetical protein
MRNVSPKPAAMTTPDEILLETLAKYDEAFDAAKIHGWVTFDDPLWQALDFLRVRPNKLDERAGVRRLNETSLSRIRSWFRRMHRKPIGGHMLVRHRDGWCTIRTISTITHPAVE